MIDILYSINPGLLLIVAGMVCAVTPIVRVRQVIAIAVPIVSMFLLATATQQADLATANMMGMDLVLYRVDSLNFIFGLAFLIAATLNAIYALHQDSVLEDSSALIYAGAAMRYLAVQVLSGILLLYGAAQLFVETDDLTLRGLELGSDAGTWLLFFAFGIKAAFNNA